jgi:hypothetical protein
MVFPTVEDSLKSRGTKRNVLHGFDQLLREALEQTSLKARNLGLDDDDVGMGCVTVTMAVAADLALAVSDNLAGVEARHFSRTAQDALAWARRPAGSENPRQSRAEGIASPSSMVGAIRVAKNRLM